MNEITNRSDLPDAGYILDISGNSDNRYLLIFKVLNKQVECIYSEYSTIERSKYHVFQNDTTLCLPYDIELYTLDLDTEDGDCKSNIFILSDAEVLKNIVMDAF